MVWMHLCAQNTWTLFWPDLLHKFTRKASLAISFTDQGNDVLKRLNRLFRSTRTPFATSQHGKLLQNARRQLAQAIADGECSDLLEMWTPGVCRDLGIEETAFSSNMIVDLLKKKAGRLQRIQLTMDNVQFFDTKCEKTSVEQRNIVQTYLCGTIFTGLQFTWGIARLAYCNQGYFDLLYLIQ